MYGLSPKNITFTLTQDYFEKFRNIKNLKNKNLFENKDLDENYNNISLFELLLINKNLIPELKPNEKIYFGYTKLFREPLIIDDEFKSEIKNNISRMV